jgi:hypothetical protein
MIYIEWALKTLLDLFMVLAAFLLAPFISIFTEAQEDLDETTPYWGGLFGTYDNPPQGDAKHQREGIFPGATEGWKGYVMRVTWLWRNPAYNFQKKVGIEKPQEGSYHFSHTGKSWKDPRGLAVHDYLNISDKYAKPGWYYSELYEQSEVKAFEFYAIIPTIRGFTWSFCLPTMYFDGLTPSFRYRMCTIKVPNKCIRVRLGYKLMTDKFQRYGFAPLVDTVTLWKVYGEG